MSVGRIAAVAIGTVFVVAGASKVARGREWPAQAAMMGVHPFVARSVPWWELAVGSMLIVGLLAPWPAIASVITLIAFTALILGRLGRGEHPPCSCFGAWSVAPLGVRHVWRNVGFLALAVVAAIGA